MIPRVMAGAPWSEHFDALAAKGAPLLGAFAAAAREEIAAAEGGPRPAHRTLRALGCLGIGEILAYRRGIATD